MSATWNLSWAGATDQGKVRSQNQDNYYGDPLGRFLVLADGMGGHSGGEVASQLTVDAVIGVLNELDWDALPSPHDLVQQCISAAIDSLKNWAKVHPEQSDLGTTLLLWVRNNDKIILASLGDSRIYLMRENRLFQVTLDQVIETEYRRRGDTREHAAKSPGAAYLSRCILASRSCEPDVICMDSHPGDLWLMCSDGLTREVEQATIHDILLSLKERPEEESVKVLIERALDHGGRDNVTVIVAKANAISY